MVKTLTNWTKLIILCILICIHRLRTRVFPVDDTMLFQFQMKVCCCYRIPLLQEASLHGFVGNCVHVVVRSRLRACIASLSERIMCTSAYLSASLPGSRVDVHYTVHINELDDCCRHVLSSTRFDRGPWDLFTARP